MYYPSHRRKFSTDRYILCRWRYTTKSLSSGLEDSVFVWPVRVYIEDTDSGGIVYYANYLRFMERARTECLRSAGIQLGQLAAEQQIGFVVRSAKVDFLSPARLDDELHVGVNIVEQKRASLLFSQPVFRAGDAPDKPLCTGFVRIACVNTSSGRPVPITTDVIEALQRER